MAEHFTLYNVKYNTIDNFLSSKQPIKMTQKQRTVCMHVTGFALMRMAKISVKF